MRFIRARLRRDGGGREEVVGGGGSMPARGWTGWLVAAPTGPGRKRCFQPVSSLSRSYGVAQRWYQCCILPLRNGRSVWRPPGGCRWRGGSAPSSGQAEFAAPSRHVMADGFVAVLAAVLAAVARMGARRWRGNRVTSSTALGLRGVDSQVRGLARGLRPPPRAVRARAAGSMREWGRCL
jgi:hypothetical protein